MRDLSRKLRNKFIREMIKKGVKKEEIMDIFNLTRQGLWLILKKRRGVDK